jgi:hypothetical protein
MPTTDRLLLPLLAAGQAQKDVTHNEALLALDGLVALAAVSRSAAGPPSGPGPGEVQIVAATATVAWGAAAGTVMQWLGSGWQPRVPVDGQLAFVADEAIMLVHAGSWRALWPVAGLTIAGRAVLSVPPGSVAAPAGGTVVDDQARGAIAQLISQLQAQGILD